jgi:hypothetical protein
MNNDCFHEWEEDFRIPWNDKEKDESGKDIDIVRIEVQYKCVNCGITIRKKDKKLLSDYEHPNNYSIY